ncbi:putative nuclease HARBI1 [Centropristis striata]|uniref:putative nuclease HARBI1 n=1 Tax=Centropristis striata TaxID=184440 RepID=UPI0027DEBCD1|nr:putative nuclease HARBI1 [Centropristis striata]
MAAIQHILAANQQRRRARSQTVYINAYVRQHFSPLDVLSDRAVQSKYRLPREEIHRLVTLVSPHIQRVVGDGSGLSKASVSRSVAAVTPILLRHARRHIRMPTTRNEVHRGFHAMAGIPRVIGVVDGTLIPIHNPSLMDPCWIGRKHYAAINTQVVVDHDGLITDIVARWPGGTHDSFVWANSAVGQKAGRGEFGRSIFLGDSGYPLRSYLVTPVTNPATPQEERFNEAHTHTRTHIERVFGRWKSRYRCVHRSSGGLRLSPVKCCRVIVVTAMLHNIAVRVGADELPPVDDDGETSEDDALNPREARAILHQAGVQTREELVNLF